MAYKAVNTGHVMSHNDSYQLSKCGRGSPADCTLICSNDDAALPDRYKHANRVRATDVDKKTTNSPKSVCKTLLKVLYLH